MGRSVVERAALGGVAPALVGSGGGTSGNETPNSAAVLPISRYRTGRNEATSRKNASFSNPWRCSPRVTSV